MIQFQEKGEEKSSVENTRAARLNPNVLWRAILHTGIVYARLQKARDKWNLLPFWLW